MPLIQSPSKLARQRNIRRLIDEGYPPRQAVAIGYSTQRRNRAGKPSKAQLKEEARAALERASALFMQRAPGRYPFTPETVLYQTRLLGRSRILYDNDRDVLESLEAAGLLERVEVHAQEPGAHLMEIGQRARGEVYWTETPLARALSDRDFSAQTKRRARADLETMLFPLENTSRHYRTLGQPVPEWVTERETEILRALGWDKKNKAGGRRSSSNRAGKVRPKDEADARAIVARSIKQARRAIEGLAFDPSGRAHEQEAQATTAFNRIRDRIEDAAVYLPPDERERAYDAAVQLKQEHMHAIERAREAMSQARGVELQRMREAERAAKKDQWWNRAGGRRRARS